MGRMDWVSMIDFPEGIKPYNWHVEAWNKFFQEKLDSFAFLCDVGTGKTFGAIMIMRQLVIHMRREINQDPKILVIGPGVVINNWKREIQKFSFPGEFEVVVPLAIAKGRKEKMQTIANLQTECTVIVNYEAFDSEEFAKAVRKWKPDIIVADELHRLKSPKSKRAKAIVDIAMDSKYRFGLTGSAVLNSPMDLFMQWKFLDKGKSFGGNFFNFRNLYFYDANGAWSNKMNHFPKFEPIPEKFPELSQKIQGNSIRVKKDECLDLPPFIEETLKLEMGTKQARAYAQMEKDLITFIETSDKPAAATAQLAIVKALRLMQIASGFIQPDIGEEIVLEDNPKLDAIEQIIEDNPDEKIIIWCSFKANYRAIGERLSKLKVPHVFLTGEQDAKEKQDSIDSFQTDPATRIIVANRKAGGIGVNLTAASLSIIFSRNFSLEEEIQSDGRNYRGGSQIHESITKINLVMEGTIEEKIILALQKKSDIASLIVDLKRK